MASEGREARTLPERSRAAGFPAAAQHLEAAPGAPACTTCPLEPVGGHLLGQRWKAKALRSLHFFFLIGFCTMSLKHIETTIRERCLLNASFTTKGREGYGPGWGTVLEGTVRAEPWARPFPPWDTAHL